MNTTTRRTAHYHARQIRSSQYTADGLAQMVEALEQLDQSHETIRYHLGRLRDEFEEMELDLQDCIEAAAADGYTPDDIEAAS